MMTPYSRANRCSHLAPAPARPLPLPCWLKPLGTQTFGINAGPAPGRGKTAITTAHEACFDSQQRSPPKPSVWALSQRFAGVLRMLLGTGPARRPPEGLWPPHRHGPAARDGHDQVANLNVFAQHVGLTAYLDRLVWFSFLRRHNASRFARRRGRVLSGDVPGHLAIDAFSGQYPSSSFLLGHLAPRHLGVGTAWGRELNRSLAAARLKRGTRRRPRRGRSTWRRVRQATARYHHYRARLTDP